MYADDTAIYIHATMREQGASKASCFIDFFFFPHTYLIGLQAGQQAGATTTTTSLSLQAICKNS